MGDLTRDLAEVQRSCKGWIADVALNGSMSSPAIQAIDYMFSSLDATIQQNAEDAKRLRALERALNELDKTPSLSFSCSRGGPQWLRIRAAEILREGEPHDQD